MLDSVLFRLCVMTSKADENYIYNYENSFL